MVRRGVLSVLISGSGYKSTCCESPSEQSGCGQDSHKYVTSTWKEEDQRPVALTREQERSEQNMWLSHPWISDHRSCPMKSRQWAAGSLDPRTRKRCGEECEKDNRHRAHPPGIRGRVNRYLRSSNLRNRNLKKFSFWKNTNTTTSNFTCEGFYAVVCSTNTDERLTVHWTTAAENRKNRYLMGDHVAILCYVYKQSYIL